MWSLVSGGTGEPSAGASFAAGRLAGFSGFLPGSGSVPGVA
jgi:hypothetical protein